MRASSCLASQSMSCARSACALVCRPCSARPYASEWKRHEPSPGCRTTHARLSRYASPAVQSRAHNARRERERETALSRVTLLAKELRKSRVCFCARKTPKIKERSERDARVCHSLACLSLSLSRKEEEEEEEATLCVWGPSEPSARHLRRCASG